jgi:hypothetical protein
LQRKSQKQIWTQWTQSLENEFPVVNRTGLSHFYFVLVSNIEWEERSVYIWSNRRKEKEIKKENKRICFEFVQIWSDLWLQFCLPMVGLSNNVKLSALKWNQSQDLGAILSYLAPPEEFCARPFITTCLSSSESFYTSIASFSLHQHHSCSLQLPLTLWDELLLILISTYGLVARCTDSSILLTLYLHSSTSMDAPPHQQLISISKSFYTSIASLFLHSSSFRFT